MNIADSNKLSISVFLSNLGGSLTKFFIPLFIYKVTQDPLMMAIQTLALTFGNITACYAIKRITFFENDKQACSAIDVVSAFVIILPIFFNKEILPLVLYISSFISAFLETLNKGYYESIIGSLSVKSTHQYNRQSMIGKVKSFENSGSMLGFIVASPFALYLDYKWAFLFDGLTFLISAYLIYSMINGGVSLKKHKEHKTVWSILFSSDLKWLSSSHAFAAFGLFAFNASAIFILKDNYKVSDFIISIHFILQFFCSVLGSILITKVSKNKYISKKNGPVIRLTYAMALLGIAFSNNEYVFILFGSLLATIHAFSIPVWQSFFQESSVEDDWKVIGTSRKTLVSLVGAIASLMTGFLLKGFNYSVVFYIASTLTIISTLLLYKYSIKGKIINN